MCQFTKIAFESRVLKSCLWRYHCHVCMLSSCNAAGKEGCKWELQASGMPPH